MDETTLKALRHLKELTDARMELEREGLLTPVQLKRKITIEEQMKFEIANCMRARQAKINEKKKEEEKMIGQMTYKLKRKLREMNRLKEEEDYRQKVEERYEAKMKKEKEAEERKKMEKDGTLKNDDKKEEVNKDNEMKKGEDEASTSPSTANKKNKKNRQKNNKSSNINGSINVEACQLEMESLSL